MKFLLVILFLGFLCCGCKKEDLSKNSEQETLIIQMEVVNSAGQSIYYAQQVVK